MARTEPSPFRKTPLYAGRVTAEAISAVFMTLLPLSVGIPLFLTHPWHPAAWPVIVSITVLLPALMFLLLYPGRALRPELYQEGFVPAGASGFTMAQWVRRHLSSKVLWGEVESVTVRRWKGRDVESEVEVAIEGHGPFRFHVAMPDNPEEAEVSLMLLERWRLLGGSVREEEQ